MDRAFLWRQRIIFENNFLDSSSKQYPVMTQFDGECPDDISVDKLLINHQPEETSQSVLNEREISNFMKLSDCEMMNLISPFFMTDPDYPGKSDEISPILLPREPPVTHEGASSLLTDDLVSEVVPIINTKQLPEVKEELRTPPKNPRPTRKQKIQKNRKNAKKDRRANRSIHLWEFLRELLTSGKCTYIQWISEEDGTFRLVNSSAVAKLWGERKNRHNMTYEKMSRALRYYYEKQILERVPNARLIYKFGNRTRSTPSETSEESLSDCSDN